MQNLNKSVNWKLLSDHRESLNNFNLRTAFADDTERFDKYSIQFNDIFFDYSKNLITEETIDLLVKLAEESGLNDQINKMFDGEKINFTENRAVLHTALRNQSDDRVVIDGKVINDEIQIELTNALKFADSINNGTHLGFTGQRITDVVNIGIGGSHLGPEMVCTALQAFSGEINIHFVANVDPVDINSKLSKLNPETTLFLIASKTFTTQETMTNAEKAKKWFLENTQNSIESISKHFAALSTNIDACQKFGISVNNIFGFWDWVGGRYSLWSVIGLSIAIYIGSDNFRKLLSGAYQMDVHFRNTKFKENIPVLMALLGIWYNNFWDARSYAIIPYDQYLLKFSEFLQQLDMESNGKRINSEGTIVDYLTGPIIWGTIGTNSQHSFFQLIHQGTQLIPVDFIAGTQNHTGDDQQHAILLSNFFAQTEALMKGKNEEEVFDELSKSGLSNEEIQRLLPHKVFPGNKPTNTILYKKITPEVLGSLIAMYEHKVFVQGVIWGINSFDQWGVELGKVLAKGILSDFGKSTVISNHDSSTNGLINYYKSNC